MSGSHASLGCFQDITHEVLNIPGSDMGFSAKSLNHHHRLNHHRRNDGQRFTTRAVVVTDRNDDGSIAAIRVYSKTSPSAKASTAADRSCHPALNDRSIEGYETMKRLVTKPLIALFLSISAALSLAGCAGVFGGQSSTDLPSEAQVVLPSYAKGDWYAFNDGSREVVVEIDGEMIVWQDERGRLETRYRNPVLPRLRWPRGETRVMAEPDALWPLMPGNTASFRELRNEFDLNRRLTQSKSRVWRCRVLDMTFLETEVGTFETYPISCELRSSGGANRLLGTRLWHYAPAIGHYVRREKIDGIGTREIRELIESG